MTLYIIPTEPHNNPKLNSVKLEALDNYLRDVLDDDGRLHVLGFYRTNRRISHVMAREMDWSKWNGATIRNTRWDPIRECRTWERSFEKVNVSMVRPQIGHASTFGLIAHELAHGCGATHGDARALYDTATWETLAVNAWMLRHAQVKPHLYGHYQALRNILVYGRVGGGL